METPDGLQLRDYWRILVRRRTAVVTCAVTVVAVAAVFTFLATPTYEAGATLQIQRHGPDILTHKDVLNVDPSGYADFYQTQYRIIQSRSVLRIAVDRIDLVNRPEYAARRRSPAGRLIDWARAKLRSGDGSAGTADPMDAAIDFLDGGLSIRPVRKSYLVKITFADRNPALAAEVANAIAEAYQQFNLEARYSTTAQASEFLTKQVAQLQAEIADRERQLQEYGKRKEILAATDDRLDISSQALADLNGQYVAAKGRLALAESRYMALREATPDSLPQVASSPLIRNLKQQYAELERRHRQMSERFHPEWPALRQLSQELAQARDRLELETEAITLQARSAAEADYHGARSELEGLYRRVEEQKGEVRRVNADAIEYASVAIEIENMRGFLTEMVNRQSQTELSDRLRDTRASNVTMVDRAETPQSPIRPKKKVNLALSVIMGLLLGVGAAFLLDHLDNTVKNEQDVARLSGLTVIGRIPMFKPLRVVEDAPRSPTRSPADLGSQLDPRSGFAEAFKSLRTSLLLAAPDRPPRHIVVTSCEPGDGKSTVSVNLAVVLSQLGARVLLVDADLRRPSIHEMLHLPNRVGLSSFLTGNAELQEILQDHPEVPSLRIVTSGPIPPTPSELLGSSRLQVLMDLQKQQRFDHILFDSPPLVSVTDSIVLSTRMDSTVLVVRAGETGRDALSHSIRELKQSRANVVGAVLNAVADKTAYYQYYSAQSSAHDDPSGGPAPTRPELVERRAGRG